MDFLKITYITEKSLKVVNKKDGKDEPVEVTTLIPGGETEIIDDKKRNKINIFKT